MQTRPSLAFALVASALAAGCGPDSGNADMMMMSKPPAELPACSKMLPPTAKPSFTGDTAACTEATTALAHHAAADIVPDGYVALGPAVSFDGSAGPFPHGIDLVVPADLAKAPTGAPSSRIVVIAKRATDPASAKGTMVPASNLVYESYYKRLHLHAGVLGTYQAAIPKTAGQHAMRHFTYRAIGGVSMGGIGSSMNFWRHPDRYDAIAVMGADPGPDLTYTLGILHDWFFAGFCDAASGKLGQLCPPQRKPMLDQFEEPMDFEHLNYQAGEGVGLTLRRTTYVRAFRDLSRALGNAAYANDIKSTSPSVTYLPPGVPPSVLATPNNVLCGDGKSAAQPVVLKDFYDRSYNPDGKYPVITFCDGGDSDAKGLGVFDGSQPQMDPTQILLAVDLGDGKGGPPNGVRDSGEPVLLQASEHWDDVGIDGLPDAKEPGYDPVTNPDPNHDDYHWYWNPTGTEGNWRYDQVDKDHHEPFDDCGVDGVCGKGCTVGTAPPQGVAGCYDYGEGNHQFDYAPGSANWVAHDPHALIESLDAAALARLDVYYDAGIRDFLNAEVSTDSLAGVLDARGQSVRVWEGFPMLTGFAPSDENRFKVTDVDFAPLGRHLYVRYGDPDATPGDVKSTGDGRHVGTVDQAIHRGQMLFAFLSHVWPDGDTDADVGPGRTDGGDKNSPLTFKADDGRVTPYTVVLPPGYDDPANASKRYPVFYMMHGYGMQPQDLAQVAIVAANEMVNASVPPDRRLQKFIIVFVDGVCRPGGDVGNMPLAARGDVCEEGTFYTDHADGVAKAEAQLAQLQGIVEANYRVKAPADLDVVQ